METDERWYTTAQIAAMLHIHPRTVTETIRRGELRAVKLPSNAGWRVSERDLHAWLDSHANQPPASEDQQSR